jgi:hypothetical protein
MIRHLLILNAVDERPEPEQASEGPNEDDQGWGDHFYSRFERLREGVVRSTSE